MAKVRITARTKQFSSLISPARDRNLPVYNWHAFKHSYSKELVKQLVDEFDLDVDDWVLDPFSGGGTTLLACKELGINSKGFDILPFSVFLSNVKTRNYDIEKLQQELTKFEGNKFSSKNHHLPDIGIANKAFGQWDQNQY